MQSEKLIQTLLEQTKEIINRAEKLRNINAENLLFRYHHHSWNILECLEHLNLYGNFYLPQIEKALNNSESKFDHEFKSGFLGSYFAKSMLPKEKANKMKTFKSKNPFNLNLNKSVIDNFIKQQLQFIDLLNKSRGVSLKKIKVATSISSLIKLNLGDTFQFIINHNLRHLNQIDKICEQLMPLAKNDEVQGKVVF